MAPGYLRRSPPWLLLSAVVAPLVFPVAAVEGSSPAELVFTYTAGSEAWGSLQGSCEARAVQFPEAEPGWLRFAPVSATLHIVETWINSTVFASETGVPIRLDVEREQRTRPLVLPPGAIEIAWPGVGRASLFEHGIFRGGSRPFQVTFAADGAAFEPAVRGQAQRTYWVSDGTGVYESLVGHAGWARHASFAAPQLQLRGNATLYLEEARVEAPGFRVEMAPYKEVHATVLPMARHVVERYQHGLLDVSDVRIDLPSGAQPHCQGLRARVDGGFTAYDATGTAERRSQRIVFDTRVLTATGHVRLDERLADEGDDGGRQPVSAVATGNLRSLALDFEATSLVPPPDSSWQSAAAATGILAGTVLALWKLVPFVASRLQRAGLLDRHTRRRVLDAIRDSPGVGFVELCRRTRINASTLRYHLAVLVRHRLVRSVRVQGRLRFLLEGADAEGARRSLLLQSDPKLRDLLARLEPGGTPAKALVEGLRRDWGLSRSGSWKVIERAQAARLVVKERCEGEVKVRFADEASPSP